MATKRIKDDDSLKKIVWEKIGCGGLPRSLPEETPTKSVGDLLMHARKWQKWFAKGASLGGNELTPFDTGIVRFLWDDMRRLGAGANMPEDPSGRLETIGDVKRAVDDVVRWCDLQLKAERLEYLNRDEKSKTPSSNRDDKGWYPRAVSHVDWLGPIEGTKQEIASSLGLQKTETLDRKLKQDDGYFGQKVNHKSYKLWFHPAKRAAYDRASDEISK